MQAGVRIRWVLALLVAVLAIYAPTLGNGFAGDDDFRVKAVRPDGGLNPITDRLHPVGAYFDFTWKDYPELYRPVTVLSYALTNELTGGADADPSWEAFPHHLLNVLLHVWAVFLAWRILFRITSRGMPALLGASVFGLHAIHSEAVAGIVGRGELFAFCFGAQALILFMSSGERPALRRHLRLAASSVLFFLAYCSKETAIAWLPFLVVFVVTMPTENRGRNALVATAVAAPPLALFLFLRLQAMGSEPFSVLYMVNPLAHVETTTRVLSAVMIWGYGLFKCLWPFSLSAEYGVVSFRLVESFVDFRFLLAAAGLIALLVVGLVFIRRHPPLFIGIACLLGFGFVTSNIPFAIGTIFGERLYFTPSLGIAVLVAWTATIVPYRWLLLPLGAWLVASTLVILQNNSAWANDTNLVVRDYESNPRSVRRLDQRARQLRDAGRHDEAEAIWRRALDLDPLFPHAVNEFALYLANRDRFVEAEALLVRALAVPEERRPMRHITHLNLSILHERMGAKDKSMDHLRQAWREDSAFEDPHDNLMARTQAILPGDEIGRILVEGERRAPDNPQWAVVRGKFAYDRKDFATAETQFRLAVEARPRHAPSRFALATVVHARGRTQDARKMLEALRDDATVPGYIRAQVLKALR